LVKSRTYIIPVNDPSVSEEDRLKSLEETLRKYTDDSYWDELQRKVKLEKRKETIKKILNGDS